MVSSAIYEMSVEEAEKLANAMKAVPEVAEAAINKVLHGEASVLLQNSIKNLMPRSGRNWSGKRREAKAADSLQEKPDNLKISITTKTAYNYLYFPDDGSTTKRHAGNQHFFRKGVEINEARIVEMCEAEIAKQIQT